MTIPLTYKITDYNREEIQGSFYEQELQKTTQDIFRIEKKSQRDVEMNELIMPRVESVNERMVQYQDSQW